MTITPKKISLITVLSVLPLCFAPSAVHAQTLPQISGLQMHMDANADGAVIIDGNNHVVAWNDNARSIQFMTDSIGSGAIYQENVVNGLGAIQFDGSTFLESQSQNALDLTRNVSGITAIAVGFNAAGGSVAYVRFDDGGNTQRFALGTINSNSRTRVYGRRNDGGTNVNVYSENGAMVLNEWRIDSGIFDYANNSGSMYKDGELTGYTEGLFNEGPGTSSDTSSNAAFLSRGWNGYIAEILVFDRALDENEILAINQYLGEKYGIGVIPEPSTYALILAGGMLVFAIVRRRKK